MTAIEEEIAKIEIYHICILLEIKLLIIYEDLTMLIRLLMIKSNAKTKRVVYIWGSEIQFGEENLDQ